MEINNNDRIELNNCDISKPITIKSFIKSTGLSRRATIKALRGLEEKGIIKVFSKTRKGTSYIINYDLEGFINDRNIW